MKVVFLQTFGMSTSTMEVPVVSIEIFLTLQYFPALMSKEHLLVIDPPTLFPSRATFYSYHNSAVPNHVTEFGLESGLAIQAVAVLQHVFLSGKREGVLPYAFLLMSSNRTDLNI